MDNILNELKTDKQKTIALLKSKGKKRETIDSILKEFYENKRNLRDTQVGKIQQDKPVDVRGGKKLVKPVKLSIPFQKKIVTNSTAFEVGKPVTLVPNTDNKNAKLPELIKKLWSVNRIDSIIQKLVYLKKAQTEGALMFYIDKIKPDSIYLKLLNRLGFKETKQQIKLKLLDNRKGSMYPYFDDYGDMKAFVWEFKTQEGDKTIENTWVFDEKFVHKTTTGNDEIKSEVHGFDRIPIVYVSQEETEWKDAQDLIDRYEVALSKLAGSNDYTAHPMVKVFGKVLNAPDKDEDGKAWLIPIEYDKDGNEIKGDVQLITNPNSADSTDLELSKVEDAIYAITSTVNFSFNNVKGLGNVSGIALTLMFMDSNIKATLNEGDNRTMIERIINILISGTVTTTNTALKNETTDLYFEVLFNSILPADLKEAVETVSQAVTAGIMSKRTAVEYIDMNPDVDEELKLIEKDKVTTTPNPNPNEETKPNN